MGCPQSEYSEKSEINDWFRITLQTYSRRFQKWAYIFTIFHAVVLLDSSNW